MPTTVRSVIGHMLTGDSGLQLLAAVHPKLRQWVDEGLVLGIDSYYLVDHMRLEIRTRFCYGIEASFVIDDLELENNCINGPAWHLLTLLMKAIDEEKIAQVALLMAGAKANGK